jgi:hypothetical protein
MQQVTVSFEIELTGHGADDMLRKFGDAFRIADIASDLTASDSVMLNRVSEKFYDAARGVGDGEKEQIDCEITVDT